METQGENFVPNVPDKQPVFEPKKSNKALIITVAIVIVIVAITAGFFGYLFAKKSMPATQTGAVQPPVTQPVAQVPALQPATDETAGPSNIISVQGIKMTLPSTWSFVKKEKDEVQRDEIYIKDNTQTTKYNTYLVLTVRKNEPFDIKSYKEERDGFNYTVVRNNGEIFDNACGGAIACNGAIINNDVYYFGWNVQSDQPAPKNLNGIWEPDYSFSKDAIWEMLKSIIAE